MKQILIIALGMLCIISVGNADISQSNDVSNNTSYANEVGTQNKEDIVRTTLSMIFVIFIVVALAYLIKEYI